MLTFREFILEKDSCDLVSQAQLKELEKFVDNLLAKYKIDIGFTKHFRERISDERNVPCIKLAELKDLFKKISVDQGRKIKAALKDDQAVLVDLQKDLNLPFIIDFDSDGNIELVMKTIMRKKNFKTPNRKVVYEASEEISLWKYNKRSGYWEHVRKCSTDSAETWLKLFKDDEPKENFIISKKKPSKPPAA